MTDATEMAGTRLDFDADLESAAIEHLLQPLRGPAWFRDPARSRPAGGLVPI